jgi:predicted KAP-like P-loop ATPase
MEDLKKQAGVKSVNPMYATSDGLEMPVTDEFVVQFKENASKQAIDEMRKKYHIEIKEITKLFFIFSVPVDSNVLEVANAYQESWLTNFSNPTFFAKLTHSNY